MTHADEPKAGRRNPSCLFCAQAPLTEGVTAGAATFFSCRRHSSFLSLCFPPLYTTPISLYTVTASPEALCPSEPAFSVAKVLPRKHTQVPLALFEHNFPAAFPIYNRPYLADARYRNDKIPPKFLVCCFLLGNLWMRVKIRSLREKPEGFRREGKIKNVQPLNK